MDYNTLEIGKYLYNFPDTSGGNMHIHGFTQDRMYAWVTYENRELQSVEIDWLRREKINLVKIS